MPESSRYGPFGEKRSARRNTSAHLSRARQFAPFAALKGYYELVRECERVKEPKRDLSEETLDCIYGKLFQVEKGNMVRVTYYDVDAYMTIEGLVANVDHAFSRLTVAKTTISFDDVLGVALLSSGR